MPFFFPCTSLLSCIFYLHLWLLGTIDINEWSFTILVIRICYFSDIYVCGLAIGAMILHKISNSWYFCIVVLQLSRIIYLFSSNMHDASLSLSIHTTCARLMLNLVLLTLENSNWLCSSSSSWGVLNSNHNCLICLISY